MAVQQVHRIPEGSREVEADREPVDLVKELQGQPFGVVEPRLLHGGNAMTKEALQELLDKSREHTGVPGAAMAYIDNSEIILVCSGCKNMASKEPVASDSIFQAASLSKQVLAHVVLQLIDKGLFNLDTPAVSIVSKSDFTNSPWSRLLDIEGSSGITVRNILSHSTGLPNWASIEDIHGLLFSPGSLFAYTGMSYIFLQWILENLLKMSWQDIAEKYVFNPLSMNDSGFIWKSAWEDRLVHGHDMEGKPEEKDRNIPGGSAGGLLTCVPDYAVFFRDLLLRMRDGKSVFSKMYSPQVDRFFYTQLSSLHLPISWGLGIGLENYRKEILVWQVGANPKFYDWLIGNPDTGRGVVIFTNSEPGHPLLKTVVEEILGPDHPCFRFNEECAKLDG
jgi:CubicO group peptidase (beta-lactamase class C family)